MPLASAKILPRVALVLRVTTSGDAALLAVVETASVVVVDAAFFLLVPDLPHAPNVNPRMTTAVTTPHSGVLRILNLLLAPPQTPTPDSHRRNSIELQRPNLTTTRPANYCLGRPDAPDASPLPHMRARLPILVALLTVALPRPAGADDLA